MFFKIKTSVVLLKHKSQNIRGVVWFNLYLFKVKLFMKTSLSLFAPGDAKEDANDHHNRSPPDPRLTPTCPVLVMILRTQALTRYFRS